MALSGVMGLARSTEMPYFGTAVCMYLVTMKIGTMHQRRFV